MTGPYKDTNAFVCSNCGAMTDGYHSCGYLDSYPPPRIATSQEQARASQAEAEVDRLTRVLERIRDSRQSTRYKVFCSWCRRWDGKHMEDCPTRIAAEALKEQP